MFKNLLLTAVLIGLSSSAMAAQKLPFVGTKMFNFHAMGDGIQHITIDRKGNVKISRLGFYEPNIEYDYRGKYQKFMPDGRGGYYQIKGNKIYSLNSAKRLRYECGYPLYDSAPCRTHLNNPY